MVENTNDKFALFFDDDERANFGMKNDAMTMFYESLDICPNVIPIHVSRPKGDL